MDVEIVTAKSIGECEECRNLAGRIWGSQVACSAAQMGVHANYGGVVLLARQRGEAVGFLFSFPVRYQGQWVLWSHETGVLPAYLHKGIGYTLKREQQRLARELGYQTIAWTYDPLVSRNAFFNLVKLGAGIEEFKVNVYGQDSLDVINQGLETDRFIAVWPVDSEHRSEKTSAEPDLDSGPSNLPGTDAPPEECVLCISPDGDPVIQRDLRQHGHEHRYTEKLDACGNRRWFTEIPKDFNSMAARRPEQAEMWRKAFREQALALFSAGCRPVGFDVFPSCGCYTWRHAALKASQGRAK